MKYLILLIVSSFAFAETAQQKKDAELVRQFQEINRKMVILENEKAELIKAFDCEARGMKMQLDPVHLIPACAIPPAPAATPPAK